jgi:RNA polymerase sigma-70 factor, ECF subfamily
MNDATIDVGSLAARYTTRLRLFGMRHLGERAKAEDLAQETLRRVFEAVTAGRIHDPRALGGFVYETAWHVIQQHYRHDRRTRRAFARLGEEEADPSHSALENLISEERREAVRQALSRLEPDDRTLLAWLYHEGLTITETASRLGIEAGTLRVRKHRALQRLGKLLAGNGPPRSGT